MAFLTESELRKLAGLPPKAQEAAPTITEEATDDLKDFTLVKDEEDEYKEIAKLAADALDTEVDDLAHICSLKNPDEVAEYVEAFDEGDEGKDGDDENGVHWITGTLFDHPAVKVTKEEDEGCTCFFVKLEDVAHLKTEPSEEPAEEPAEAPEDEEMEEAFLALASKIEGVRDRDALTKMVKEVYKAGKADSGKTVVAEDETENTSVSSVEISTFNETFKMREEATKQMDRALTKLESSVNIYNINVKPELKAVSSAFDNFCSSIESIEKDILEEMQERAKMFAKTAKEDTIKKNDE